MRPDKFCGFGTISGSKRLSTGVGIPMTDSVGGDSVGGEASKPNAEI